MDEQMVKVEMSNKELNRMIAIVGIVDDHFKDGEIKDLPELSYELEDVGEL